MAGLENRLIGTPEGQRHAGFPIILYDGVCGLCNRFNRFVLRRDRRNLFRFASLQSGFARALLAPWGKDPGDLDTVYLILDSGTDSARLLSRGRAALEILTMLGGVWRAAGVLKLLPAFLLDAAYNLVVRNRYRFFGRSDTCPIPEPQHRDKFIEV